MLWLPHSRTIFYRGFHLDTVHSKSKYRALHYCETVSCAGMTKTTSQYKLITPPFRDTLDGQDAVSPAICCVWRGLVLAVYLVVSFCKGCTFWVVIGWLVWCGVFWELVIGV